MFFKDKTILYNTNLPYSYIKRLRLKKKKKTETHKDKINFLVACLVIG